ncbi:Protein kinase-like superfamily protein [Klebsormidium nitens]|uniref:Protein kinase-like superfamily protein n=1 Tax=Klebsormidium nitens TaxID=105231 RepID=A0A1Y1IE02_KLENI|nr:Protein kinase-like superfamily protein [Klebsormidium nitens]|eukprot:GAQ86947.1 Protein kinase-like superfamily protein [Klebsormidium nitens]
MQAITSAQLGRGTLFQALHPVQKPACSGSISQPLALLPVPSRSRNIYSNVSDLAAQKVSLVAGGVRIAHEVSPLKRRAATRGVKVAARIAPPPIDVATGRKLQKSYRTPATASDPEVIQVGADFVGESGASLANGWKLGKQLGAGVQGAVFLLENEDGSDAGRVFKQIRNKEIGEVTGNLVGLEREWAIGRQLNLLDDPDGYLPGFMQTGSKVLDHEGQFLGMTLEKLNGGDVLDRFEDPLFNDVDYILNLIVQVLCALDRAQQAIGFFHQDMRIHNVMEHRLQEELGDHVPEADETQFGKTVDLRGLQFKIIDYGHAVIVKGEGKDEEKLRKARRLKVPDVPAYSLEIPYRAIFNERGDVWRFVRSVAQALEGRTWPRASRPKVKLIQALVRKTCGVSIRAHYASSIESGERKKGPLLQLVSFGGSLFPVKWADIMLRAYVLPGHPTMQAREALAYLERKRAQYNLPPSNFTTTPISFNNLPGSSKEVA